ncbi:MAG TPA: hypothetical protein V6D00_06975 [Pantanalinema sp.]
MDFRRATRGWLLLACTILPLLACASEDDGLVGVGGNTGQTPTPTPTAGGDDPLPAATFKPLPTPTPTPLPSGFDNSGTRPGAAAAYRPRAIGIDPTGSIYLASDPNSGPPYRLTVMDAFTTVKATASLGVLPERFAFVNGAYYFVGGNKLVTMTTGHAVASTETITDGDPYYLGLASSRTGKWALAYGPTVRVTHQDEAGTPVETFTFPGGLRPRRIAFDYYAGVWGIADTTLAKFERGAQPKSFSVAGVGDLMDLAVDRGSTADRFWVLGTTGIAKYNRNGDRLAGPFSASGSRIFLDAMGRPIVVSDADGKITRYKVDGTPETPISLNGGFEGAAMDIQGDLWVSSRTLDKIAHTRFE